MSKPKGDFYFRPLNAAQADVAAAFAGSAVTLILGPAGSGKTHVALALAAQEVMSGRAEKLILCRPLVEAGERLGFLPGDVSRKLSPWIDSARDVLRRMTFQNPDEWLKKNSEVVPLALMRGRTFDRRVAVLTEAQNATLSQLKLFLTRIGSKGKLILEGDPSQTDIPPQVGLDYVASRLSSLPGVSVCRLLPADIVRHPIIPQILSRLP